ncbi:unnamed protein product [Citrullus colocynthis]|uniref:Secreted protein n=1 Tax=Citrullus colocynthis TaxID=252529 RepID=A0ABP0XTW1_9ROSI
MPQFCGVFLGVQYVVLAVPTTIHHLCSSLVVDPCSATIARQVSSHLLDDMFLTELSNVFSIILVRCYCHILKMRLKSQVHRFMETSIKNIRLHGKYQLFDIA